MTTHLGDRHDFKLLQKIGSGAFSKVHLARHEPTNELVAIKVIDLGAFDDDTRMLLMSEAKILNILHHPGIVELYQVIEGIRTMYLVMEFAELGTLSDLLRIHQRLADKVAAGVFSQICNALAFMHEKSISHRDIKPDNIFINQDNHAKLGDFGFATMNKLDRVADCGSPQFAAPEVVLGSCISLGNEKYDSRTGDMWAIGVTLYLMMMGDYPYVVQDLDGLTQLMKTTSTFPLKLDDTRCNNPALKILLGSLMTRLPQERWTAQQALLSPWIHEHCNCEMNITDFENTRHEALEYLRCPGLSVMESIQQRAKKKLHCSGAPIEACDSVVLRNPRDSWAGFYRILRHKEIAQAMSKVMPQTQMSVLAPCNNHVDIIQRKAKQRPHYRKYRNNRMQLHGQHTATCTLL